MTQYGNLKISYNGNRRLMRYKLNSTYEQIFERIMHRFQIPINRKSSMYFTNTSGKVFSKRQLNSYFSLFPSPRTTFYLRYKSNGNKNPATKPTTKFIQNMSTSAAITNNNKTQKRQRDYDDDYNDHDDDNNYDSSRPATPVFRMNCFIGVYPTQCSPPPVKRVRFSEDLNRTHIIPARSNQLDQKKGVLLRRVPSFYDAHPENVPERTQQSTGGLATIISQTISESTRTLEFSESPTTQFALCSPLLRTKSFINTYPKSQSLISSFFQKKAKRMLLFGNAQSYSEL